jgi:sarcosine oxidase
VGTGQVDVAIVGAGAAGLATARALARTGRSVIALEQFDLGHTRGSSHGTSRIFRLAYEDPEYVAMAKAALPLWRELERESGLELLTTTGALDVGGNLESLQAALAANGVPARILARDEVRRRFPRLHLPEEHALFQADGGIARPDRTTEALAHSARSHGAEIREQARVQTIEADENLIRVTTSGGVVEARAAVIAAGAWSAGLLRQLGIELPVGVTRETVVHFRLDDESAIPTVIDRTLSSAVNGSREAYALPSPGIGIKAGIHRSGAPTDPDTDGSADDDVIEGARAWVEERYELADPAPALVETCLYTTTPDERFVLERHGRIVVCSACSGHGYKHTPEIGRRAAALADEAVAH